MKRFQFKRVTRCTICKERNGALRNDGSRCMLIDFSPQGKKFENKAISKTNGRKALAALSESTCEGEAEYDEIKGWCVLSFSKFLLTEAKDAVSEVDGLMDVDTQTSLGEQISSVLRSGCNKLAWRGAEVCGHCIILKGARALSLCLEERGTILEGNFPDLR